jgi:hypothetical protein
MSGLRLWEAWEPNRALAFCVNCDML